jgi:hypothetical protein
VCDGCGIGAASMMGSIKGYVKKLKGLKLKLSHYMP